MKKPRISLADPHIMDLTMPHFDLAKAARGQRCSFKSAKTTDGRTFTNMEGIISAVDSRPFKGGKDSVFVGIKLEGEEMLVYCEFNNVEIPSPENPRPGPVIPGYMKT